MALGFSYPRLGWLCGRLALRRLGAQMYGSDFIKSLFYPVLLTAVLVYFSLLGLHALHHGATDTVFETAMLDNTKLVLGALLGLVTGYQIGRGSNDKPAA
jgi:hypothetical protein